MKCSGKAGCTGGKEYEYNGKKKNFCCGFAFNMIPSDFEDVKKIIRAISNVVKTKEMIK